MTVLLLAQAGVPLTSGFVAKFGVIQAAVDEHSYAIAIIAMVASVIAAFLYLRIMVTMWITEPEAGDDDREPIRVPLWTGVALALSVGFTLLIGFFPGWLIDATKAAVAIIAPQPRRLDPQVSRLGARYEPHGGVFPRPHNPTGRDSCIVAYSRTQ